MTSSMYLTNKQCGKGIDCHLLCMEGVWCMALLIVSCTGRQATACSGRQQHAARGMQRQGRAAGKTAEVARIREKRWTALCTCAGHLTSGDDGIERRDGRQPHEVQR
jgi:hypothetical protein